MAEVVIYIKDEADAGLSVEARSSDTTSITSRANVVAGYLAAQWDAIVRAALVSNLRKAIQAWDQEAVPQAGELHAQAAAILGEGDDFPEPGMEHRTNVVRV